MSDEQPAQTLGRYHLVHRLGQGGMGEVYLAKISGAAGFEKLCIVKTILPSLVSDPQFLDRFHHEAKVLVHLAHSNIAQVYDMGENDGMYFMALEYVAGIDLAKVQSVARQQGVMLPLPLALYIGQKIAEGLGYAHRKTGPDGAPLGIVHRDVSPQNVMVSYEGEVKVIDFGLAKSAARSKHTLPSTVMGKLGYMSPEQARAEPVDFRSDIYSCGVVIWELLAGKPLIPHGTMGEMMAYMTNPRPGSLHLIRSDIDPALDGVIRRALAVNPAERYARADDLARALAECLIRSGASFGAEEVGNFVRQLCPTDFAEQQRLISSISLLRAKSPVPSVATPADGINATYLSRPGAQSPLPAPAGPVSGFEATTLRGPTSQSQPLPAPAPAQAGVPSLVSTNPGLPSNFAAPKSKVPLLVGALVVLAIVAGGAVTALVLSKNAAPAPTPPPADPVALTPVPTPPEKLSEPVSPEPPPVAEPTEPEEPEAETETEPVAEEPEAEAKKADARPERHRARGDGESTLVSVPGVAGLFRDGAQYYVRAGSSSGITVGAQLQVVGPPLAKGKRRLLGTATALEVWPTLARVSLDDAARDARGKRFVGVSPAPAEPVAVAPTPTPNPTPAPTPTPEPAAQQPPKPKALAGRASVGGFPFASVTIYNSDRITWNQCDAIIKGRKRFRMGSLAPGGKREIPLGKFVEDASMRFVGTNLVGLTCQEGLADFPVKF